MVTAKKTMTSIFSLMFLIVSSGHAIHIEDPEFIYKQPRPSQKANAFDAVTATLRVKNNRVRYFLSTYQETFIFNGTVESPWINGMAKRDDVFFDKIVQKRTAEYIHDIGTIPNKYKKIIPTDNISIYLKNVLRIGDKNELIGFFHSEYLRQNGKDNYPAYFAISVGYSKNNGDTWTLCGDIIHPPDSYGNVGGVPYLIVDNYIYVYFNERTHTKIIPSMARAEREAVIDSARAGTVCQWMKWGRDGDTTWHIPATERVVIDADGNYKRFPVLAGERFPITSVPTGISFSQIDMHGDAAYCEANDRYYMVALVNGVGLCILESGNGFNWSILQTISIKKPLGRGLNFPFFVSIQGGSDDFHTVGRQFYIYFIDNDFLKSNGSVNPRHKMNLYRVKVTVDSIGLATK